MCVVTSSVAAKPICRCPPSMGASAGNFLNTRSSDSLNTDCSTNHIITSNTQRQQGITQQHSRPEEQRQQQQEGSRSGHASLVVGVAQLSVVVRTCPKESARTMSPPVFSTHTFISIMPTCQPPSIHPSVSLAPPHPPGQQLGRQGAWLA